MVEGWGAKGQVGSTGMMGMTKSWTGGPGLWWHGPLKAELEEHYGGSVVLVSMLVLSLLVVLGWRYM